MIKINSYETFDEIQVEKIVNNLIKSGKLLKSRFTKQLYSDITEAAAKLGYIKVPQESLKNLILLRNKDFLKVVDNIWDKITKGYLAPGRDHDNPFFPWVHLTEKGRQFFEESWEK